MNRPRVFEFGRTLNDYFGFGAPDPHLCLEAHLARREVTVMFRELLRRYPEIRSTSTPPQMQSSFTNGIKHRRYHH